MEWDGIAVACLHVVMCVSWLAAVNADATKGTVALHRIFDCRQPVCNSVRRGGLEACGLGWWR